MSEPQIRLTVFLLVFGAMALFEIVAPRLKHPDMAGQRKGERWLTNIGMAVLSTALLRLVFPAAAVGTALWAESRGLGLFQDFRIDPVMSGILSFVILDFAVWLEHVASHKIPLLWRIHGMHHSDTGFDLTTALRFHPIEILLSMIWKAIVIVALGTPATAVLVFEIVLNATAMFNHANARIPAGIDRWLRLVVVTPDMHRVHHSVWQPETDSNYGFNLPVWDRLFGTYRDSPAKGHEGMIIGLEHYRGDGPRRFFWTFMLPFRRTDDPVNKN